MALHGGGHLELKKCTRGIFWASSEFVWGDVQVSFLKKSAFCNFIPGSCVFFTNALALYVELATETNRYFISSDVWLKTDWVSELDHSLDTKVCVGYRKCVVRKPNGQILFLNSRNSQ